MHHLRRISIAPAMTEEEMAFQEVLFLRIAVVLGALLSRKL